MIFGHLLMDLSMCLYEQIYSKGNNQYFEKYFKQIRF